MAPALAADAACAPRAHVPPPQASQLPRAASPAPGGEGGSGGGNASSAAVTGAACAAAPDGWPWALAAIGEPTIGLPASAPRVLVVLVCLISSGVAASSPNLVHNAWSGCATADPLGPSGCVLSWARLLKPRGTCAASIIAARPGLGPRVASVTPGGAALHAVGVNPDSGSIKPGASAPGGRSRLRAHSVCEGRLRGLQAEHCGASGGAPRWRMVVLAGLTSAGPAEPIGSGAMGVGGAEWRAAATGVTAEGRAPDVLLAGSARFAATAAGGAQPGRLQRARRRGCGGALRRRGELVTVGVTPLAADGAETCAAAPASARPAAERSVTSPSTPYQICSDMRCGCSLPSSIIDARS
ncbi:hypothetical protein HT031_001290 [Scenedesmus sp. PABB004]|nr:hypothetical protein HT031_001290 [Scenedesmus sp. PABB004]